MSVRLVYMTAKDKKEARHIGGHLVKARLAACVNIFCNINSLYVWKGGLQDDQETAFIAKTTQEKLPALIEAVKAIHSYECPCVIAIPVPEGNADFMDWIDQAVGAP